QRGSTGLWQRDTEVAAALVRVRAVTVRHTLTVVDHNYDRRLRVTHTGVLTFGEALVPAAPGVAVGIADVPALGDHCVAGEPAVVVNKETAGKQHCGHRQ
ncbi:MAG: hypothetical protein ACJA1R_002021, partial [Flavobacteriales bacterium]